MGLHGAHLGPTGPRWAPCWPHGPCYQGYPISRFSGIAVGCLGWVFYFGGNLSRHKRTTSSRAYKIASNDRHALTPDDPLEAIVAKELFYMSLSYYSNILLKTSLNFRIRWKFHFIFTQFFDNYCPLLFEELRRIPFHSPALQFTFYISFTR